MGFLDDLIAGGKSAVEGAAGFIDDHTALGSHRRNAERAGQISDFAISQGYALGASDPGFRRAFPDLATESDELVSALTQISTGIGAGAMGAAARTSAGSSRGPGGPGVPPPPQPGVPHPQGPPGGTVPSTATTVPGTGVPPGPIGPTPGRVNGGIPMPGTAVATRPGLLTTLGNLPGGAKIAAGVGAVATGIGAGGLLAHGAANRPAPIGQAPGGYGPGTPITDEAWAAEQARQAAAAQKEKDDKAAALRARGATAEVSLTESQAAYYQAQREKALRELQNDDLSDKDKEDLAHQYAMAELAEKEKAATDRTMIGEAGATERTTMTEAGANRRADQTDVTQRRGQDQQAQAAQATFVNNWLQNQILNGQLSLDKATKLMEAYTKQQKLPSEILGAVTTAVSQMAPYMTNRGAGEAAFGFESGGAYEQLFKMAGGKNYKPPKSTSEFNPFQMAREYGAVPPPPGQMPTVDQVFQGAGQGADMSAAGAAQAASTYPGQAPSAAVEPQNLMPKQTSAAGYSSPMPRDAMERIMGGLR